MSHKRSLHLFYLDFFHLMQVKGGYTIANKIYSYDSLKRL